MAKSFQSLLSLLAMHEGAVVYFANCAKKPNLALWRACAVGRTDRCHTFQPLTPNSKSALFGAVVWILFGHVSVEF